MGVTARKSLGKTCCGLAADWGGLVEHIDEARLEGRQIRDELATDSGRQEPLMAGSTNDIALVSMETFGA